MSTYIINQNPNCYGNQQQDYVGRVDNIVAQTANKFSEAVASKTDLKELFHQTLASFGEARHNTAIEHGTEKAEIFGKRRDSDNFFDGPYNITPLGGSYKDYGDRLLSAIQKQLKTTNYTLNEFRETTWKIPIKSCLGRVSSMEFNIFNTDNSAVWTIPVTYEYYLHLCQLSSISPAEGPLTRKHFVDFVTNKKAMQGLKQASIDEYKRLKIYEAVIAIREFFVNRKMSDYILVTVRSHVDGRMFALAQYLTWTNRDFSTDPVDHMKNWSTVSIIHQDPFLIEPMLSDIANIFERVLNWDKQDINTLKNNVALLQWELAYTMPFRRGSAAIAEWFERSIYLFHGFNLSYNQKKMVNLEALTLPLPEFVKNYSSMIRLKPI